MSGAGDLARIEGHLSDISVALDDLSRSVAMAAEIYRFKVATDAGVDPLAGTDYEEEPGEPRHHGQEHWANGEEGL